MLLISELQVSENFEAKASESWVFHWTVLINYQEKNLMWKKKRGES